MITLDYNQLLIAACTVFPEDFKKGGDTDKMFSIARHTILGSILSYKRTYGAKYGNVVIACDGRYTWRKKAYQYYKAHRAKNREVSETDWETIFKIADAVRQELIENFPYKVIWVPEAEADDIIAVLAKWTQENELDADGLEETPQKFLNVSADHDFRQLYKYKNYAQWSPIQKKAVTRPEKTFLVEKIIRGDKGDGIPSVLCPDDFFVNDHEGRAPSVTVKVIDKFMNKPETLTDIEKTRFDRNRMLIDFECIPAEVESKIIEQYTSFEIKGSKSKIFDYCMKHRLKRLMENIQEF